MVTTSYTNTDIWDYMFAPFPPTEVKVKVKFTLEEATKAHRLSRGIALLFL
jgi:hypothetical protein